MATNALSTRASRRAILAAAVTGPSLAAAATYRFSPKSRICISAGLAKAIKHAEQCEVETGAYHKKVFLPARARFLAAKEALPHTTVDAGPSVNGGRVIWSTTKDVAVPRTMVAMGREGKDIPAEALKAARNIVAAHLRRERAIARVSVQTGVDEARERSDDLGDRWAEAQDAVADYPAATIEDLKAKLECIVKWELEGWHIALLDDAKRIAGGR